MKGRPHIYHDNELVLKAQQVFWERGFSATTLTHLSKATGAGAGSLYNRFKGGKKELFLEAIRQRKEELYAFKLLLEASDRPVVLIKNFFREIANADKETHQKGCIIANTLVEMTFIDQEIESESIKILQETEQIYTAAIKTAQEKGDLKSSLPAQTLGKHLITLWCGINSLRRMYPDKKVLTEQIELQLSIID